MKKIQLLSILCMVVSLVATTGVVPSQAADPYIFGYQTDITGVARASYAPIAEGFRLYMNGLNDRGGVNGHPVKVIYEDDKSQPGLAGGVAEKFITKDKVLYTGYTSLATNTDTYDLIREEVIKGNETLSRVEQVKDFRIIPKELDPEVGDTTPPRKIKRSHMYEMFKDLVEEIYASSEKEKDIISAQLETSGKKEG